VTVLNELASEIDLLLTDVILPDENGRALAANMLRRNSRLKVLYVSGYPDQIRALQGSGEDCLPKPYSSDLLLQKVAAVLGDAELPLQETALMLDAAVAWPA
jgi:DNA-binding response OmpR family regulator